MASRHAGMEYSYQVLNDYRPFCNKARNIPSIPGLLYGAK